MPGDVRYLYREPVINVVVVGLEQNRVRVVPGLGPQIHWSRDKPLGRCPSFQGGPLGEFGRS